MRLVLPLCVALSMVTAWQASTQQIATPQNLLGYPGTQEFGNNVLVHELAHNIHSSVRRVDPKLDKELQTANKEANAKKMYLNARGQRTYAVNMIEEYLIAASRFSDGRGVQRQPRRNGIDC